jgi:hypothetical protein
MNSAPIKLLIVERATRAWRPRLSSPTRPVRRAQPPARGRAPKDTNTKITRKDMAMPGFTEAHAQSAEVVDIAPGLVVRRLWRSGPERTARRAGR